MSIPTQEQSFDDQDFVAQAVDEAARWMAVAAITAPKAKGEDYVAVKMLSGESVRQVGQAMVDYGKRSGLRGFERDGGNVLASQAVLLIGLKAPATAGLDCGACGYETCAELELQEQTEADFRGPICAFRLLDMGIAIGSAVKTASLLNVDNRVIYRIGVIVRQLKLVDWPFVMGVPLSATSKSIFFDR